MSQEHPLRMLPEIVLFGGGLVVLLGGSYLPRSRQWVARAVALLTLLISAALAVVAWAGPVQSAFQGSYAVDVATGAVRVVAALAAGLVLLASVEEVSGWRRESEFSALVLFATTGTVVLAGAADLLVMLVAFLLASIPLYALVGMVRDPTGAEAAMKTYLVGALFGIVLMLGVTLLYGLGGATRYADLAGGLAGAPTVATVAGVVAVLAGLMFKAGGLPAHFWVPDAATGAVGPAAMFVTTVPKVGALVAAYRLVVALPGDVGVSGVVAVLAVASMTLGNLAAYWQSDPRRLLGWSTVSQVGFLLVPVAVAGTVGLALPSLLVYLAAYAATNVAAFAVAGAMPGRRDLGQWRGTAAAHPWLSAGLVVALLGLVGTPPTGVFVGKLTTATAAWDGGLAWLALVALANSVLSLFYYLRWVAPVFGRGDDAGAGEPAGEPCARWDRWSAGVAVGAAALSLGVGLAAGALFPALSGPLA